MVWWHRSHKVLQQVVAGHHQYGYAEEGDVHHLEATGAAHLIQEFSESHARTERLGLSSECYPSKVLQYSGAHENCENTNHTLFLLCQDSAGAQASTQLLHPIVLLVVHSTTTNMFQPEDIKVQRKDKTRKLIAGRRE